MLTLEIYVGGRWNFSDNMSLYVQGKYEHCIDVQDIITFGILAFTSFLALINPLGITPVFYP